MHSAEAQFLEVAKRHAVVGMQVAQAFNAAQAKLGLDVVLSQKRLSTAAGTAASLAVLEELSALTARHKAAFSQVIVAAAAALRDALVELPQEQQVAHGAGIVSSLNWQLAAQSRVYENRVRWIDAAKAICTLIESRRSTAEFLAEGVVFADDEDHRSFESLMGVIDEVHRSEVDLMNERASRIAKSASILGLRVGS